MKIVIVDTTLQGPLIGGAQTFLPDLVRGLTQKEHTVHVVSGGEPDKRLGEKLADSGAILHTDLFSKKMLPEDAAKVLADWTNGLNPDVYLISVSWDVGWLALPLIKPGIITVAIAHSNNNAFYFPAKHYKTFISAVIGVSHEICDKFHTVGEINKESIYWIPYGVNAPYTFPEREANEKLNLIFVGRLEEADKRISDVADIIKRLEKSDVLYQFTIVGDGSRKEHLDTVLSDEIGKGHVKLTGWLSGDEVIEIVKKSDIFILTSSSEGFSISLIEAMANGCCPVVTDIPSGSVQLIRNDENGFLIPVGDIPAFAEKISFLFKHRDKLRAMQQSAWETGMPYSIEKMTGNYLHVFSEENKKPKSLSRATDPAFPIMESCRSKYPRWARKIKLLLGT